MISRAEHSAHFQHRIQQSLLGHLVSPERTRGFGATERTVLLYRDWMDGAMLAGTDTRTTTQLLGSPALRQFQQLSQRIDKKDMKALAQLDLDRQQSLLGGPYLWFNFISRAVAHGAARLIIEYNGTAIPLTELTLATPAERARYDAWLTGYRRRDADSSETREVNYVTTAFTALHFLDADPQRDREVNERFGPAVLERLRQDRRRLIRQVFGTLPLHRQPKALRVLNLYTLYTNWLAGGRALLMPWFLLRRAVQQLKRLTVGVWRAVRDLLRPAERAEPTEAADADFATAVRKIERMRGPVLYACIRLRVRMDPEYLGVSLPGWEQTSLGGANLECDRRFLDPDPQTLAQFDAQRRRAEVDMQRLGRLIEQGLLQRVAKQLAIDENAFRTAEHVRAAAIIYLGDLNGVRRHLSARKILRAVYNSAALDDPYPTTLWPHFRLRRMFNRYWRQHGTDSAEARHRAWRATLHNVRGVADVLRVWHQHGDQATAEGERRLADLLRHPGRITEQLVTIRTVQTLAMIDVLNYRQHVYRLGEYAATEAAAEDLLQWDALNQIEATDST